MGDVSGSVVFMLFAYVKRLALTLLWTTALNEAEAEVKVEVEYSYFS